MARLLHQHTDTLATQVDRLRGRGGRLAGRSPLAPAVAVRTAQHAGEPDRRGGRSRRVGAAREASCRTWCANAGNSTSRRCRTKSLGQLIAAAKADRAAVEQARQQAEAYVQAARHDVETERTFIDNAFLLEQVFRGVMAQADCRAMTINGCMGTIMPMAETSACLTLSLLNDAGYQAFCESDFVVIPAGILLANISGRPVFLNDPTYPHDQLITLAHCTAPRRMSGEQLDAARIMTHFESDYGAAPKVEMPVGQIVTNIVPDFKAAALDRSAGQDRRGSLPAHLPLADRHSLRLLRRRAGPAHARLPLDHRLRRLPARSRLRRCARSASRGTTSRSQGSRRRDRSAADRDGLQARPDHAARPRQVTRLPILPGCLAASSIRSQRVQQDAARGNFRVLRGEVADRVRQRTSASSAARTAAA